MKFYLQDPQPIARKVPKGKLSDNRTKGHPFFEEETIELPHGKQKVLIIRVMVAKAYTLFRLRVYYAIGGAKKHVTIPRENEQPLKLTFFHCASVANKMTYKQVFQKNDVYAYSPVAHPEQMEQTLCHQGL
jgi:hypothetical protein